MKANKFFLGLALIGAILTGCDKGQEPETNGDEAKAYMSVKITMASTAGTRATDGGFAEGTTDEQKIDETKSIFLFYDEFGKWVTAGQLAAKQVSADSLGYGTDHSTDINDLSTEAYIVLSGPDDELKKSRKVLTVVNYSGCESLKYLDLEAALDAIATDATGTGNDPANAGTNGFLMSTSVYVDGSTIVNTTAITDVNIQPDVAKAKANPVDIYIERAAAKADFTISTAANFGVLTGDKQIVVDGVLSDAKVTITGWNLNNVYKQTYVVKQLLDTWKTTAPFNDAAWNWKENHRSYWAKGHNWNELGGGGKYVYAYEDATLAVNGSGVAYCYENTVATPDCDASTPSPNVNTILIAAKVEVGNASTDTWEAEKNLYEYAGVFYRENTYLNLILKQITDKGYKKSGGTAYTISDLVVAPKDGTSLDGIKFTITGKDDTQIIDTKDVEAFVNGLAYVTEAKGYANGKCYYQIPVEHLGTVGTPAAPNYGMVRNHWYKISVSAINHVGDAVFDETVDIPGIPEKNQEYYLSAKIHVLSWHIVNQSVEL